MSDPDFSAGIGRVTIPPPMTAAHAGWGAQTHTLFDGVDRDLLDRERLCMRNDAIERLVDGQ